MQKNNFLGKRRFVGVVQMFVCFIFFIAFNDTLAQSLFPGKIIAQSSDPLITHYASPSIVILPDGSYVASHDWSGKAISGIHISIHKSYDKGKTWRLLTIIQDIRWANLFIHKNELYVMGVDKGMGNIHIRKSKDGGETWTEAKSENTGVLAKGRYHTGPVPMVIHKGRIWRAFEESPDAKNERDFYAFVMSAPLDADLLKASSWTMTNKISFDRNWLNADRPTWLEGNVVITPEGKLIDMLRIESKQIEGKEFELTGGAKGITRYEVAAFINISDDGKTAIFNEHKNFVHFPGAQSKFTIRYDPISAKYWTISNKITNIPQTWTKNSNYGAWNQRNVLVLSSSKDLKNWETKYKILRWNEGKLITRMENFAFHYADWQFEGNDIVLVSRTSWYSSYWHNANMVTFHRLENFRKLSLDSSPADLGLLTQSPGTILSWQFSNPNLTGMENDALSNYADKRMEVSKLVRGAGLKNDKKFRRSFSASSASYQTPRNKKADALANDEFFQFDVQAKEGYRVSVATLEFKLARNVNGARNYRLAFSKDNKNFTEVGSGDINELTDTIVNGVTQPMVQLVNYKELQNVPSSQKIYFRLYVWGAKNANGRISLGRFDENIRDSSLIVGGTVVRDDKPPIPLLAWSMENISGNTLGNLPQSIKNNNVESTTLQKGAGLTPLPLKNAYYAKVTSFGVGNNLQKQALANQDYYTFGFKPKNGKSISLSSLHLKLRRNISGPMIYQWRYSVDGKNFKDIENSVTPFLDKNGDGAHQPILNISKVTDLQNISSERTIYFRLYVWGSTEENGAIGIGRNTDGYSLALYGEVK